MARRFKTWTELLVSGAEHRPHGLGFAVVRDGESGEEIARQALVEQALRVSRGLQSLGLRKGSVVVLQGEPSISWAATFAGVLLAGGLPAPMHARSTKLELARVIATAQADLAVVSAANLDLNNEGAGSRIISFEHVSKDYPSVEEMFALEPASPVLCHETDFGVVMQTSGTTGHPKCVVHTHASHLEFIDRWSEATMIAEDRALSFLPLNHQSGLLLSWLSAYALGSPYYQLSPFTLAGFWDAVRAHAITWTSLIAPVPGYMLEAQPSVDDNNHRLRFVAGSRRPSEVVELERRFGIRLVRPYGSTETTIVAVSVEHDRPAVAGLTVDELASCAGPPMRDWAFRIVGEDGSELPHCTTGDLEVQGPSLFSHYLNDPEATARAFTKDGWFRTGDRAYVNGFGELFFVERAGNAIRRSGEMISAAEVEETLVQHPAVREAAVVAVPDDLRGQEVRACIVRAPNSEVSAHELFQHCRASLAKFKVPRYIDFWDEFPRTSTLKISRGELKSDPATWVDRYRQE